jgi:hypothetical protein
MAPENSYGVRQDEGRLQAARRRDQSNAIELMRLIGLEIGVLLRYCLRVDVHGRSKVRIPSTRPAELSHLLRAQATSTKRMPSESPYAGLSAPARTLICRGPEGDGHPARTRRAALSPAHLCDAGVAAECSPSSDPPSRSPISKSKTLSSSTAFPRECICEES